MTERDVSARGAAPSTATILALGAAGTGGAVLALMMSLYAPAYYATHAGLTLVAVGGAFSLSRLIGIPIDLAAGFGMDRTSTMFGRYRIWFVLGAPLLIAGAYLLLSPQPSVSAGSLLLSLVLASAGLSLMSLAQGAWASGLDASAVGRRRVFGWLPVMQVLATGLLPLAPTLSRGQIAFNRPEDLHQFAAVVAGLVLFGGLLALAFVPERLSASSAPSSFATDLRAAIHPGALRLLASSLLLGLAPGVAGAMQLYVLRGAFDFVPGQIGIVLLSYVLIGIIGAPFWGTVGRLSKARTLQWIIGFYILAELMLVLLPRGAMWSVVACFAAQGFAASGFQVLLRAMAGDVADEVSAARGGEHSGLMLAIVSVGGRLAGVFATGVAMVVLSSVHYPLHSVTAPPEVASGLVIGLFWATSVIAALGGAALIGFGPPASPPAPAD